MIDAAGEVMYVGKARNLKARVTNYTRPDGLEVRLQRMIAATHSMEFVRTETESEALLLEANLIKRLKPRFNVLLRDDKTFPYILIATDHEAPEILKHRGTRRRKGYYFGPFASAVAVKRTITSLQKAFLLRSCSDSFYAKRAAALPAAPDQALLGPLHPRDRDPGLRAAGRGRPRLPLGQVQGGAGPTCRPR